MYRSDLDTGDRAGTIVLVALIHAALAYAFLNISGTMRVIERQIIPQLIDVNIEPPPPPIVEVPLEKVQPKEKEGAASPKNIESQATPVAAPKPRIELPVPPPMPVTETPREGSDPTQGASPVRGPGTGAGGTGTGTGAGGSGSGTGGGGAGVAVSPSLLRGITNRDFPDQVQRGWPRGGAIFLRLRIEANGRPSQCDVMRSYGDRGADQWACSLIMERGQFRPARNARGLPVPAWFGYVQRDTGRIDR
jgi:periplasmic protein TonB